jgi:hypothetical protein
MSIFRPCTPLLCLLALFLPTRIAQAQVSAYGAAAVTNYCISDPVTNCKSDGGGFIGGAFYNFPLQSRLTAGVDARGSYSFGDRGGTLATASLRIGFVPHHVPLRPYFQLGGGIVSSQFLIVQTPSPTFQTTRHTNGALVILAGLDIRLTDTLDLRAIEIGAASGSTGSAGSAFVDAGLVYHFRRRAPKH